jgi:hypothetical protein
LFPAFQTSDIKSGHELTGGSDQLSSASADWVSAHSAHATLAILTTAFALRLHAAWGMFLNPDEALHFQLANQNSLAEAYRASLTSAHPPGLILLLYFWRNLGTSEIVLRLPSVIAGTLFCWVCFRWAHGLFGRAAGWIAFVLVSFLPPLIELSSEVRQYAFLLAFAAASAYFLERALDKKSSGRMLLSFFFLYLAMMWHYSALLFAATMGIYFFARALSRRSSSPVTSTWMAGQAGALGLFVFLYKTHISQLHGNNGEGSHLFAANSFLRNSYFYPGHDNPAVFVLAKTGGVFQYLLGQLVVGDLAFVVFVVSVIVLLSHPRESPAPGSPRSWQLGLLAASPFAINGAAALAGRYPYGGNRHCVFLAMFGIGAVSYLLAKAVRQKVWHGIVLATILVVACNGFGKPRAPYIPRALQSRVYMDEAVAAVRELSTSEAIFTDYESGLLLGHYLCQQKVISFDNSQAGFQRFECDGHMVITVHPEPMIFTADNFAVRWQQMKDAFHLASGQTFWVFQAGWDVHLVQELQATDGFQPEQIKFFGKNVELFRLSERN